MKHLTIIMIFLMMGCESLSDTPQFNRSYPAIDGGEAVPCRGVMYTFDYDGCEYIWYDCWNGDGTNSGMTHKGNCTNH